MTDKETKETKETKVKEDTVTMTTAQLEELKASITKDVTESINRNNRLGGFDEDLDDEDRAQIVRLRKYNGKLVIGSEMLENNVQIGPNGKGIVEKLTVALVLRDINPDEKKREDDETINVDYQTYIRGYTQVNASVLGRSRKDEKISRGVKGIVEKFDVELSDGTTIEGLSSIAIN